MDKGEMKVRTERGVTVNMGNYNSEKLTVSIEGICKETHYNDEFKEQREILDEIVSKFKAVMTP